MTHRNCYLSEEVDESTPAALDASLTWITAFEYAGATLTAACISEVVAPPIRKSRVYFSPLHF